ncbi:hypothetical protein QUV83_03245 [Cellulomonas cellasea]|uniref:hypothetical protein n=1 Tax=Cellulomonas cellasea TaxID=43670 RepID=UPI0025A47C7A|nr:hypothetical protein [Cellulomonas cellasea]MDM8083780.1 hypothetical protein [Cellulomonas cellasea]
MDQDAVNVANLWVQSIVALAAVVAAVVALMIGALDRRNARSIAAEDRRASLAHAKLMFDLDVLSRLLENLNRGGSSDPAETKRMGAEALTLIGLLGPDLLPTQWTKRVGDEAKLQGLLTDDDFPEWKKNAIEAQVAVNTVLAKIRAELARSA